MTIRVQYHNGVYDIVSDIALQRMIDSGKVKKFYRYSEKRWVAVGVDAIRKQRHAHVGSLERRSRS